MKTKVCNGCKKQLPFDSFGNKSGPKANKDGKRSRCKECETVANKIYRAKNPDIVRASKSKWLKDNKDKKAYYDLKYRLANAEKIKLKQQKWAVENQEHRKRYIQNRTPEQIAAKKLLDIEYGRNNRDKTRISSEKYRKNNPEKARASSRQWEQNNRHKVNAKSQKRRANKYKNGIYFIKPQEIQILYKSMCFYCKSQQATTLDHVIPIARGGVHSIGNLLPACKSCNSSKGLKTITEWKKWQIDKSKSI